MTEEDRAFAAVRDRVEAGEYRNTMPGIPGEDLDGGGAFECGPDGRLTRFHYRWEPGFRAARQAGRIPPLPPLTPATAEAVEAVEAAMGIRLPRLLRRCYLELGDGGFGPAYGLVPVSKLTFGLRQWSVEFPPEAHNLLEICEWGCGIASFVDPHDPAGRMWAVDPNPPPEEELAAALFRQDMDLATWLLRWAEDRLYGPWLVRDPGTGAWREATPAEYDEAESAALD